MPYCPADCGEDEIIANQSGDCELLQRVRGIARLWFFNCTVALPSPFTCEALEALVTGGQLAFSSPLANVELADPTFEPVQLADCIPAQQVAVSRVINFQDRIAVTGAEGSPSTPIPFFENDFWADKRNKQAKIRYAIEYCDGSVQVAKDPITGAYLEASLNVFRSNEVTTSGDTRTTYDFIKGTLAFKGDPLDIGNKPELTAENEVFNVSECTF